MSNKLINWEKMSTGEKIKLLMDKKVSNLIRHYKVRIPQITAIINKIAKNESLKLKYQIEIINIKTQLTSFKEHKRKKTKDNLVKLQKNPKKCPLKEK